LVMSVGRKRLLVAIAVVLAAAIGFCLVKWRGVAAEQAATSERIQEDAEGRKPQDLRADELAALARDMRDLAQRYLKQGDKRKAQRAIGAAQEMDRKILELRGNRR